MLAIGFPAGLLATGVMAALPLAAMAAGFAEGTPILGGGASWSTPVEQVRVGDRVRTVAVDEVQTPQSSETAIAQDSWQSVSLSVDGATVQQLLPASEVAAQGIAVGGTAFVGLRAGLSGTGTVTAIDPCPAVPAADGRVVAATASGMMASVAEIRLENPEETLVIAVDQKLWSVDRSGWVMASDVAANERLLRQDGTAATVLSAQPGAVPVAVVQIDVEGDGRCFIGASQVLASAGDGQ